MRPHPNRLIVECPLCKASYREATILVVSESDATQLYHCTCTDCQRSVLASVTDHHGWISTIGLVSDLTFQDALWWRSAAPITGEECLTLTDMIHEDSRSFCHLLQHSAYPGTTKIG